MSVNKGHILWVLIVTLSGIGCGWWQPFHATPLDALTEFPGHWPTDRAFASVLQQQRVAEGVVMLYKHPDYSTERMSDHCLSVTFVTPEDRGWRAQSSGSMCGLSDTIDFGVAYTSGGNVTALTSVYGFSQRGHTVRMTWSNGQVDTTPVRDGSFLLASPETLRLRRVDC
jgi:hypothetical protein